MALSEDTTLAALHTHREKMLAVMPGEPAIEVPLSDIAIYVGDDGKRHALICMDKLIYLVDRALRQS